MVEGGGVMFELKPLSADAIPAALSKAERYRLLNEPDQAESICLDILATEPGNREALQMLLLALQDAGYHVLQAEDGIVGLQVLKGQTADVIITDINMPRLDGFGFIQHVRRDETHRAVPILVLTTESDAEKKSRARNAGATGWIVKPFNPEKLAAAIRRVLH